MLYPVMPIYLRSIGFSVLLIGILEGVAEATAGLSKGYFGKLSDETGRRVPFIRWGYAFSAFSKPLLAAFVFPVWIFLCRTIDRFGKGLRTASRDALLSDEARPETKGKVFGFHRSMDTLGAVLGPFSALIFLHFYPEQYRVLFLIAFVPGILAITLTWLLKEKTSDSKAESVKKFNFFAFVRYWKASRPEYRYLVSGLLIFTLFNSSDIFLLLKIKESGASDPEVLETYIFYNLIYALLSFPLGSLGDRIGLKPVLLLGLLLFSITYFGFSFTDSLPIFYLFLFFYAGYAAATEGIAKAWISNIAEKKETATAIGTFTAFQSIFAMLASTIAGFIWLHFGATVIFSLSAFVTLLVAFYLFFLKSGLRPRPEA